MKEEIKEALKKKLEALTPEQQWGDEIFFSWTQSSYLQEIVIPSIKEPDYSTLLNAFDEMIKALWLERRDNPAFEKDWEKAFKPMWKKIDKQRQTLLEKLKDDA